QVKLTQGNTKMGLMHIAQNHFAGSGNKQSGKFDSGTSIRELVRIAQRAETESGWNWNETRGSWELDLDMGSRIGVVSAVTNEPTSVVRIIVNRAGEVVTMYPAP
ncbi:MAG: hypothetical protein ABIV92_12930, partial [Thermoflexales bacterium]